MRPVVHFPRPFPINNIHHHHQRSGLYGLVMMWGERGMATLKTSANPFIWWGEVGQVLLYPWDLLEHLNPHLKYQLGLFANADLPNNGRDNRRWIYWPREPYLVESWFPVAGRRTFEQRRYQCVWMGGYENLVQRGYRDFSYWLPACDFTSLGVRGSNLNGREYLRVLVNARFGLCLRGYGSKCQREIECLAMGCVPILTPGVNVEYHEPLVCGRHYLFARSVEDVQEIVRSTSAEDWAELSWQGRDWYWRNCAPAGAFETTKGIVDATRLGA